MSIEEYHARQRANAVVNHQSQTLVAETADRQRLAEVRRRLVRAKDLIDQAANPEAYAELEWAITQLTPKG